MLYIEFTSRRTQPGVRETDSGTLSLEPFASQLQRFHRAVLAGQSGWESSSSVGEMISSVSARTSRLRPEAVYLTTLDTPTAVLKRHRLLRRGVPFRQGQPDRQAFPRLARIDPASSC